MAIATIASFAATWFLHAYQWFWLRGQFLLTWPDVLFWTILAALVLHKNLSDQRKPRPSFLTRPTITPGLLLRRTLRASGVFFTMAVLWSFWYSPTIGEWVARFRVVQVTQESLIMVILGTLAIMTAIGIGIYFELRRYRPARVDKEALPPARFFRHAATTAAAGLVLVVLGNPDFITHTPGPVKEVLADLRVSRLSSRDRQLMERGYYEDLIGVDRFNQDLWQLYAVRPPDWVDIEKTDAVILEPNEFINYRLKPETEIIFHNVLFKTNRWGMRDQEYTQQKPAGTARIVLVGSSRAMGSGVELEDTFEFLVEQRLNQAFAGSVFESYEILNMSVAGYTLVHQVLRMDEILAFQPDLVIIEVNPSFEISTCFRYMLSRDRAGIAMPDAFLQDLLSAGQVSRQASDTAALAQLMPYGEDLFDWAFTTMADRIKASGAEPLILYFPSVVPEDRTEDISILFESGTAAGFRVIDLADVFRGEDANTLIIAPWDYHPNAVAHRILAEALIEALVDMGSIPPAP